MKVFKKIVLILVIAIVATIVLEYAYSQRWRLTKSVSIEEYPEYIVGEWGYAFNIGDSYLPYVIVEKLYISESSFSENRKYYPEYPPSLFLSSSELPSFTEIENSSLFVYVGFRDNLYKQKNILHVNEDYLVFDEPSNSFFGKIIPRKESYRRLD